MLELKFVHIIYMSLFLRLHAQLQVRSRYWVFSAISRRIRGPRWRNGLLALAAIAAVRWCCWEKSIPPTAYRCRRGNTGPTAWATCPASRRATASPVG